VRATKNRFGAVNELGFFAMSASGLKEVRNPAAIFLARSPEPAAGSIVTVSRDGGRPLLIELQALVDRMRFGAPRRIAQGLDAIAWRCCWPPPTGTRPCRCRSTTCS